MRVGYARVSTLEQSLDAQLERLSGCEKVFSERLSGVDASRPQLAACIEYVRAGDVLTVVRLDRLARSVTHLCSIAGVLARKGVALEVLDQAIDTATPAGRLLFHMLAAIAQFERELLLERQREGIARAKARGVYIGGTPRLDAAERAELRELRRGGASIAQCARRYRISQATVYRYLAGASVPDVDAAQMRER